MQVFHLVKKFLKTSNKEKIRKVRQYIRNNYGLKSRINISKNLPSFSNKKQNLYANEPKVSVLMPVYNHASIVRKAINSILKQTYKNLEIIILDDGSTDNLQQVLLEYKDVDNIKIYKQANQKLPRALTHLHKLASGDFITWTSADNIMDPKMIETLVNNLLEHPEAVLVYGDVALIDKNGKPYHKPYRDNNRDYKHPNTIRLEKNEEPLSLDSDNYINACFLYRKEASDALLGVYADDIVGAEDYDFWLRMQKAGKLYHVKNDKPLYYYRVHDNSMSHELETKKLKIHQSRIAKLMEYEDERKKWNNLRPFIEVSEKISSDKVSKIKNAINNIACHSSLFGDKFSNEFKKINIISAKEKTNSKVYIELDKDNYYLINKDKKNPITKIFFGKDIHLLALKARNNRSHSYYVDELSRERRPIIGCHTNCNLIDIKLFKDILANNPHLCFVVLDTEDTEKFSKLYNEKNYSNFIYYSKINYGEAYRIYSNFSKTIILPVENEDDIQTLMYDALILSYATGRKCLYPKGLDEILKFPFVEEYMAKEIIIFRRDYITNNDYVIMDKYIREYSTLGRLKRIIKLYNCHTQDVYVKHPQFDIEFIPKTSEPKRIK